MRRFVEGKGVSCALTLAAMTMLIATQAFGQEANVSATVAPGVGGSDTGLAMVFRPMPL